MTAKEYLGQYRRLKTDIDSKTEQLEELRELAVAVSHSMGAGGAVGASDKVGKTVAKIVDMENGISCQIDKLIRLKKEIEDMISRVDDLTFRQLLVLRYINGHTFEQIAFDMNYCYVQICRLHGKALGAVEKML